MIDPGWIKILPELYTPHLKMAELGSAGELFSTAGAGIKPFSALSELLPLSSIATSARKYMQFTVCEAILSINHCPVP